jgi:predicted metal-dependent peptidase
MGTIGIGFDASGSCVRRAPEFLAEVRAILFDCRPEKVILIQFDAKVQEFRELDPLMDDYDFQFSVKGGGGTDFRPVFERLAEEAEPPAAVVFLTDLFGDFPEEPPPYPVIWASVTEKKDGPFGETVHL